MRDLFVTVTPGEAFAAAEAAMAGPWAWGRADCCSAACAAFAALWGIDPMAHLRGRYATAHGARRLVRDHGSLAAMAAALAARAGLATGRCAPGEIGVIATGDRAFGHALALSLGGRRWAGKTEAGMAVIEAPALAAWAPPGGMVPCRR